MGRVLALTVLVLASFSVSYSQAPPTATRDKALKRIDACLRRNEVSSRQCKHVNKDVATLVEVYKSGDKSVLPTLFRFTYLTDFYDDALLSDPNGFLIAMAQLSPMEQQYVAYGIAGQLGFCSADRFKAIRDLLESVPDSSPTKGAANVSLKTLETRNAWHFVDYFPPGTFPGPTCNIQVAWYSSDLYRLGEKPLWPPSSGDSPTFRFIQIGSLTGPRAVTLTVLSNGSGKVRMSTVQSSPEMAAIEQRFTQPADRVSEFLADLERAHFWEMKTVTPPRGLDGAEWVIEGVQDGKYHIAVRWCPGAYENSPEDDAFAAAGRLLLQFAEFNYKGVC